MAPSVRAVALLLVAHLCACLSADEADNAALYEALAASTCGSALYEIRGVYELQAPNYTIALPLTDRKALAISFAMNVVREFEPRDWGAFLVAIGNSARTDYSDMIIVNTTNFLPDIATARVYIVNKTLDEAKIIADRLVAVVASGNTVVHLIYLRVPMKAMVARARYIPYQMPKAWLQPCDMGRLVDQCNEYPCDCRTTANMVGATINGISRGGPIVLTLLVGYYILSYLLGAHGPFARHLGLRE